MIDFETAQIKRIKRANTDWWINEKSMVGKNGMTYIAYYNDIGEIRVKEIDAKCSKTPSKDVCLCRLNCTYADEHNAPSICVMENGTIIVAYTGHGVNHTLTLRITEFCAMKEALPTLNFPKILAVKNCGSLPVCAA